MRHFIVINTKFANRSAEFNACRVLFTVMMFCILCEFHCIFLENVCIVSDILPNYLRFEEMIDLLSSNFWKNVL